MLSVRKTNGFLIYLRHFRYDFGTYRTNHFAVRYTREVIRKDRFPVVYPVRTDNVFVYYVRHEIRGQVSAVDQAFSGLLYVLHEIPQRTPYFHRRAERLEIVPPVPFEKVGVLHSRLHSSVFRAVIPRLLQFSDHSARRDIEDAVEMQPFRISAALPYAYMFPTPAVYEVFQLIAQGRSETFFGMELTRERKRAEETPFLQIRFIG